MINMSRTQSKSYKEELSVDIKLINKFINSVDDLITQVHDLGWENGTIINELENIKLEAKAELGAYHKSYNNEFVNM